MLTPSLVLCLALAAPPTSETIVAGLREADGAPVALVSPTPLPEGAALTGHATKAGAITIRQTLAKKKLDLLVIAPHPGKKGALDHEILVDVTKRDASGQATKLVCSGHVATSKAYEPALFMRCYPDAKFGKDGGGRLVTQMSVMFERGMVDIAEGAVHYRAPRLATWKELRTLRWQRVLGRVADKASLPLTAQVAPRKENAWALMPDTTGRVVVDQGALRVTVEYAGATRASYRLEALPDWISLADEQAVALRLVAPDDDKKTSRVCPLAISEGAKKAFDLSGAAFTLVGACYRGLTKELFQRAEVELGGLRAPLPGTTEDGWIQLQVNDQRLLVLTSPGPSAHPDTWVRVDSAR